MFERNNKSSTIESSDKDTAPSSNAPPQERRSLLGSLFSFARSRDNSTLRDDLTAALASGAEEDAVFSPEERTMIHNILRLRESRVDDVMVPRAEVKALELQTTLSQALAAFESSGHSRMPVYVETLDDPCGMIHIRDILNYFTRKAHESTNGHALDLSHIDLNKPLAALDLVRSVLFVPGAMLASQLLSRMQATRTQMALVIDEYGGTDGLASIEDIVELVVGDIEDEHDDEDTMIVREAENRWLLDARAELDDVQKTLGADFNAGEYGEDVDTVGGLIVSVLDRIPARGEKVEAVPNYQFHILEADKRRIKRVRVKRMPNS